MKIFKSVIAALSALFFTLAAAAQNNITALLVDSSTGEGLGFATISLHKKDQAKALKYTLSNDSGKVLLESVRNGSYVFKAELIGYKEYVKEIKVSGTSLDLGTLKMDLDVEQIEAAKVSALGNPIVIKKDTIEFNANAFKTSENDVLEDLIKKLPGAEVGEDGSITVNGQTIKQIRVEGKTFFLDDPQLASKNIPAKAIEKLKVIEKKSDQAQFTGISDGEEETIIDLSMKPGMMKGLFGTVTGGAGKDLPSANNSNNDFRFQAGGFIGNFTKKTQISVILNANNTNNRGYNDVAGNMMGNMMGGGGMGRGQGGWGNGNGITTSYMAGINGAFDLLEDRMKLTGNYLYNRTDKDVWENSFKRSYYDNYDLLTHSDGTNNSHSVGNRFGVRLEHKFSENTSIIFEPQFNFGIGNYLQHSVSNTENDDHENHITKVNDATTDNSGSNKNMNASGFFLLRQRLGKEGRTLTAMTRYAFSNNDLLGLNSSNTVKYDLGVALPGEEIKQNFERNQKSSSVFARATYTEPIAENFFLEANYSYNWRKSSSDKETFDMLHGGVKDYTYSNNILNLSSNHEVGANLMFQKDKISAQVGFAAIPTHTYNSTTKYDPVSKTFAPREYSDDRWNFSPRAMFWGELNENANMRLFYWGNSSQPSTSQLMPVPDNTNPLSLSFGNPGLAPYFSHSLRGDFRYNNKKTFFSINVRFNAGLVQNPIVSAMWNHSGIQYTMPFNGHDSGNAGVNVSINSPIAKSNFSVSNFTRLNWSTSSSYVGSNIDMSKYPDPTKDYYKFMEEFIADHKNLDECTDFKNNVTNTISLVDRLKLTYRVDALELTASGRTRMNKSWYTIADNLTTWNNQLSATVNWTWDATGIGLKSDFNYNWYNGYTVDQPSQYVLNAELSKLLFKKKVTLALKGYDILGQAKNLTVTDNSNYHLESVNNTLGRYVILSLTYRFGNFNSGSAGRGMRGPGGPMGPPPGR